MNLIGHIENILQNLRILDCQCAICNDTLEVTHGHKFCFSCRQAIRNDLLKQMVSTAWEYPNEQSKPVIYIRGQRI